MSWHPDRYAEAPPEERYDGEYQDDYGALPPCPKCGGGGATVYEDHDGYSLYCRCGYACCDVDLALCVQEWEQDAQEAETQEAGL